MSSSEISRRSSRQPLIPADDTNSLTSFPDPAESITNTPLLEAVVDEEPLTLTLTSSAHLDSRQPEQLNGLLDAGPSMFDEQDSTPSDPQSLSSAPTEILQSIIDHRGAVEMVRNLSTLLAQRDAHVTALTRLAEEYKVPAERIVDAGKRTQQAERRRISLATAISEDAPRPMNPRRSSSYVTTQSKIGPTGTIRGLTKLFGGGGKRKDSLKPVASSTTTSSSRSASIAPPPAKGGSERPKSIDVLSVNSAESASWTTTLFGSGTIKGISNGTSRPTREPREPVEMSTRHDIDQLPPTLSQPSVSQPPTTAQESDWNKFLVRLMKSREAAGEEARSGELIGASHFGNEGTTGRQKSETLTRLILAGIPMRLRHPIWMELSQTHSIMQPEGYAYYLNLPLDKAEEVDAILKDVPRTLTSKYDYYAEKGYERLRRVLVAFVNKYPGLGYTQGLNMIAGYLLLAIPDESDAFWVLCKIIDDFFPANYFSKDSAMSAPIADNVLLRAYVRELLPGLAAKMDELEVDPEHTVPLSWFLTAFASVLPENALLRIWDVWLCLPGQKTFLFNIALALLMQHAKGLVACESQGEWFAYMSNTPWVQEGKVDELIKVAWGIRRKFEGLQGRRQGGGE